MLVTPEILVIEIRRRFEPFVDCSLFTLLLDVKVDSWSLEDVKNITG
jgi:hypothetical protein